MLCFIGQQYTGEIVPCSTMMIVSVGNTEAKVESVMHEFCQISKKRNVLHAIKGVVVEGIMDDSYDIVREEDVNRVDKDKKKTEDEPKKGRKKAVNVSIHY